MIKRVLIQKTKLQLMCTLTIRFKKMNKKDKTNNEL